MADFGALQMLFAATKGSLANRLPSGLVVLELLKNCLDVVLRVEMRAIVHDAILSHLLNTGINS